ncbi:DUF5040 domain-containing protein [Bacteroides sp. 519]|uniref:DUF5040 domain-containing protein n=1 Tax=Bacteroides sp. 519 TaxID=2302937 RepID=UPI0013CF5703|nr:DUF5040 domain-containing protein [Bacteroides sp. 519]NDV59238.1 DUF5040 domain-containing protein [Bacteroides sp. 519]
MKRILSTFLILLFLTNTYGQEYKLLLTGASFASDHNGWFEMGCQHLNALPINKAVGGHSITNTANQMHEGTLYSAEELEEIDALIIMHVHNRDVFEESQILEDYTAYPTPFTRDNYAICYDYVIKKYISDCYKAGKPAIIVLCTDWHDARETFNSSIRQLAAKWGLPLVEFDKNIGFSKNTVHPVTGEQFSLLYAKDTQTVNGVKHGWHPKRGQHEYIQQRMAAIFVEQMKKVLPIK